jgi:hypothetical protein
MRESPFSGTDACCVARRRFGTLQPTRCHRPGTQLTNVLGIKLQNLFCPS